MGYGRGVRRALVLGAVGVLLAATFAATRATATEPCDNAPLPGAPTLTVLVFGDSLTASSTGDWTWRYRYWKQQREAGVNVHFVGPITGLTSTSGVPGSTDETYADPCFAERAHWAVGGKKLSATMQVPWWAPNNPESWSEVAWAVANYHPDVVVQFMGANDLFQVPVDPPAGVIASAKAFLAEVRKGDPATDVAMVTVTENLGPVVSTYNNLLKAQAPTWSEGESDVGVIDVMQDWQGTADTWDGAHANARGEMHLAWDVADGLSAMGYGAVPPRPIPWVPLGPRVPPALTLTGSAAASVILSWVSPLGADRELVWSRDLTAGTPWTLLTTVSSAGGVTLTGLAPHRFEFRIQAAKGTAAAEDLYSGSVSADLTSTATPTPTPTPTTTPTPTQGPTQGPTVPVTLGRVAVANAVALHHAVALSWSPVPGAGDYRVRWRPLGSSSWTQRRTGSTSYQIPRLTAGVGYAFRIAAIRDAVPGPESAEALAVPQGTVNPAVPAPMLSVLRGHLLRVRWKPALDATRYLVQVRPVGRFGGSWRTLGWSTGTRITSGRLVPGRTYAVRVQAWDQYVAGRYSVAKRIRMR